MATRSDAPVTLGILLVHGIGEQGRGDTLVHWLDTVVATITQSIEAPARIRDWQDFWAAADPVPNGATRTRAANYPLSTRIWNEGSLLRDHTTYWDNRDGFVLPVVRILANTARSAWHGALPPKYANVNERGRWRVGWLTAARWLVPTAVVLGVQQRGAEMDAVRAGIGEALNAIGIGEWFAGIPHAWTSAGLHGGAALLAAWVGYRIVLAVWQAWVSTEQDQLLEHHPPSGVTPGVFMFGGTVMLIVAGAFYVGRTGRRSRRRGRPSMWERRPCWSR